MSPIDALRSIHEELWDAERGMDRLAPGVVPGVDISSFDLHSVRETALGAFLDLDNGLTARAVTAIGNVLALQYPASDWPWSGTFPVTAEQHDPPGTDAIEWVHYDPNWRQFLGCILALTTIHHESSLPDSVVAGIRLALSRCVDGEPDGRIAPWYTNPNLMHAWLQGHVGQATNNSNLLAAGEGRVRRIVDRFDRHGDIDEYNSPTYDGIDLFALALWRSHPPSALFAQVGATMIEGLGARISTLFHPRFGATCGPYIRAYGLLPQRYVSLAGLAAHVAGQPAEAVLPTSLNSDTVHVHDLYFLPVLQRLAPAFIDHLDLREVTSPRRHVQRFSSSASESVLRADLAVGWEHGRRHEASLDQYVPFSAHFDLGGQPCAVGLMVPAETAWIDVHQVGELEFEFRAAAHVDRVDIRVGIRIVAGNPPTVTADRAAIGPCELRFDHPADVVEEMTTPVGPQVHLAWSAGEITGRISLPA